MSDSFLNLGKQTLEIQTAGNEDDSPAPSLCLNFQATLAKSLYNLTLEVVMPALII